MHIRSLFVQSLFVLSLFGATARADEAPVPVLLRGTIARIDAGSIAITRADGTTVTASLAPNATFSTVETRTFEQIKPTDFVGTTTLPGPNNTLQAQEIHIIPTKGSNEGSFPWDHDPNGIKPAAGRITNGTVAVVRDDQPQTYTMTNASVAESSGMQLKVSYHGSTIVGGKCVGRASNATGKPCIGVATVEVPPWIPIVAIVPGQPADAKVGLAAFASVITKPGHNPILTRIVVEKNGVKPVF